MSFKINYGNAVTAIPKAASEKILNTAITQNEIKVLFALMENAPVFEDESECVARISEKLSLSRGKVESAIGFWRGAGVITLSEIVAEEEKTENKTEETPVISQPPKQAEDTKRTEPTENKGKILLKGEIPKYSPEEISKILEVDGGSMRAMIDECQHMLGRIFNSTDINSFISMCEYTGLSHGYIITAVKYYAGKKPGCNIRYVEKAIVELVNQDITEVPDLDSYIKSREVYDTISGKIRSLAGLGGRKFTVNENGYIDKWVNFFKYGQEIIEYAYEITVNAIGKFTFDYSGTILENWHKNGIKTLEEAKAENEKFVKAKKKTASEPQSFDNEKFIRAALDKSYRKLNERKND